MKIEGGVAPIQVLYGRYAHLYAAIFRDRDFTEQVDYLWRAGGFPERPRVLELFSGPAYHAAAFAERGAVVTCIDRSREMKAVADLRDSVGRYLLGILPKALTRLPAQPKFDLALIMLFSLSYLEDEEVNQLLDGLANHIQPGGSVVLELHGLQHVQTSGRESKIGERVAKVRDLEVHCLWPSTEVEWDDQHRTVSMLVELRLGTEVLRFMSRERVYTVQDLDAYASASGAFRLEHLQPPKGLFPDAELVRLVRTDS